MGRYALLWLLGDLLMIAALGVRRRLTQAPRAGHFTLGAAEAAGFCPAFVCRQAAGHRTHHPPDRFAAIFAGMAPREVWQPRRSPSAGRRIRWPGNLASSSSICRGAFWFRPRLEPRCSPRDMASACWLPNCGSVASLLGFLALDLRPMRSTSSSTMPLPWRLHRCITPTSMSTHHGLRFIR
jgi:hypothetical protein